MMTAEELYCYTGVDLLGFDDELTHYGILGMKWGRRKGATKQSSKKKRGKVRSTIRKVESAMPFNYKKNRRKILMGAAIGAGGALALNAAIDRKHRKRMNEWLRQSKEMYDQQQKYAQQYEELRKRKETIERLYKNMR